MFSLFLKDLNFFIFLFLSFDYLLCAGQQLYESLKIFSGDGLHCHIFNNVLYVWGTGVKLFCRIYDIS